MSLLWAALYILFAFLVMRWNRGILPVAAALAIILAIFAAVAAPGLVRARQGRARLAGAARGPARPADVIVVPVQLLLIVVAMVGFNQEWHVEEERPVGGAAAARRGRREDPGPAPAPA